MLECTGGHAVLQRIAVDEDAAAKIGHSVCAVEDQNMARTCQFLTLQFEGLIAGVQVASVVSAW